MQYRLSDGRVDPATLVETQMRSSIEMSLEAGHEGIDWGDRSEEVARKYAPHLLSRHVGSGGGGRAMPHMDDHPLIWKGLLIEAGSQVRMEYNGAQHYAIVKNGRIVDGDEKYSPSLWAEKVANGTSRNAWRDLWFKEPSSKTWVPAQLLRDRLQNKKRKPPHSPGDIGL